jgi:hypothetical protein
MLRLVSNTAALRRQDYSHPEKQTGHPLPQMAGLTQN